ncbi:MAG TPA: CoA pyrophosphatase [Acidimicrobiales bacterium]|nr:CoA pyrophosphatase [Acidimicrobiales bacterium]
MSSSPNTPQTGPQFIPRPPTSRPGGPAPWAGLPASIRSHLTLERVREAVEGRPTPPLEASGDGTMAPSILSLSGVVVAGAPAGVLVGLFEEEGETRVILTVRSNRLRSHTGEVAFPGGRLEPGESIDDGARREAYEEVGLDPSSSEIIGHLNTMPTVSSSSLVTPVVAALTDRPNLVAEPAEVARIFDVALSDLLEDGVFEEEWWSVPGRPGIGGPDGAAFPVWFFDAEGETIWGVTARVLMELLCLTLGLPVPFAA